MRWLMSKPFDVRFRAPSRGRWTRVGTVAAGCALLGACGFLRPSELRAGTDLLPTLGSHASGAVSFVQRADGVQVTYDLYGLAPGSLHALHLHEQGNCNARDASSAGPIFNPDAGRLKRGARPDGALGDVRADSNGNASGFIVAPQLALDGVDSAVGRAVLLHRDPDQDDTAPDRGAGPALACGVVHSP